MRLPTRFLLKPLILEFLEGRDDAISEESQNAIRRRLRLSRAQLAVRAGDGYGKFRNEHAFALVDLGLDGYIKKDGRRSGKAKYKITPRGRSVRRAGKTLAGDENKPLWIDVDPLLVALADAEAEAQVASNAQIPESARVSQAEAPSVRRTSPRRMQTLVPDEIQDGLETLEELAGTTLPRAQGWRISADERRAIERHAMDAAIAHYLGLGFEVDDVSATQPFDLRCTRGSVEKRVEVKGTTTDGLGVFLTYGEVNHATTFSDVALFVLTNVQLMTRGKDAKCAQGQAVVFDPWKLKNPDKRLIPVLYRYELPAT